MKHIENCKKCKAELLKTLQNEYGEIIEQWKPSWPCQINDIGDLNMFKSTTGTILRKIFESLQKHRGFSEFVRSKKLPACDYYIPALNRLLEFDESQHFTSPRALTLQYYPAQLRLGFNKNEWLERCQKLNRHDNDPAHRDETRAWYDTLRDILPIQFDMNHTIRIYSKHMIWCQENGSLYRFVKSLTER